MAAMTFSMQIFSEYITPAFIGLAGAHTPSLAAWPHAFVTTTTGLSLPALALFH